jgi:hypothetical protein
LFFTVYSVLSFVWLAAVAATFQTFGRPFGLILLAVLSPAALTTPLE